MEKYLCTYLEGEFTEQEAMILWQRLIMHPKYIELLLMEWRLAIYFQKRKTEH